MKHIWNEFSFWHPLASVSHGLSFYGSLSDWFQVKYSQSQVYPEPKNPFQGQFTSKPYDRS